MAAINAKHATEYLYSSARVRSMENFMVGRERLERLRDRRDSGEILSAVADCGFVPVKKADGSIDEEATLLSVLESAYQTVLEMAPEPRALYFLLYPYDCNNLKAGIKASLRETDAADLMFSIGTVPADQIAGILRDGDREERLPRHMREAIPAALDAYARTRNPQLIDLILDRACYADMLECAEALKQNRADGGEYAVKLVKAKIDLTNLLMVWRMIRIGSGKAGLALLGDALLLGGNFSAEDLLRWYEAGETRLTDALAYSNYTAFAKAVSATDGSLAQIECAADNFWMELAKEAKLVPYGYEVLAGYLIGMEYAVKNLRILLAGKQAGLSSDTLRERVRTSYV